MTQYNIPALPSSNQSNIPTLGFGTWKFGGQLERDLSNDDQRDIIAIQSAINLGLTHIDTAEMYAAGHAEVLIGQAIKSFHRKNLFIASKVKPQNLRKDDLIAAAKRSLERLQTDYLDLYYIHMPNKEIPLEDTFEGLNVLHQEKLIKNIGVSNFAVPTLQKAEQLSVAPIAANQVHYNLKFRGPERKGLLEYCQKKQIALIAWRPVQYGELTSTTAAPVLAQVAQKYSKTPAQVAINWLISQPGVGCLFMSRNAKHLEENLLSLGWTLSSSDIELLRREYPGQEEDSDRVPLA